MTTAKESWTRKDTTACLLGLILTLPLVFLFLYSIHERFLVYLDWLVFSRDGKASAIATILVITIVFAFFTGLAIIKAVLDQFMVEEKVDT